MEISVGKVRFIFENREQNDGACLCKCIMHLKR